MPLPVISTGYRQHAENQSFDAGGGLQEYVVLLAMRNVDLKELMARCLKFARRLWDTKSFPHDFIPICRPKIIMALMRW
jgi:hypothetical protein